MVEMGFLVRSYQSTGIIAHSSVYARVGDDAGKQHVVRFPRSWMDPGEWGICPRNCSLGTERDKIVV